MYSVPKLAPCKPVIHRTTQEPEQGTMQEIGPGPTPEPTSMENITPEPTSIEKITPEPMDDGPTPAPIDYTSSTTEGPTPPSTERSTHFTT